MGYFPLYQEGFEKQRRRNDAPKVGAIRATKQPDNHTKKTTKQPDNHTKKTTKQKTKNIKSLDRIKLYPFYKQFKNRLM